MLKLTTDKHEASRGLSATAELLVSNATTTVEMIQCITKLNNNTSKTNLINITIKYSN